jgi:hypothetical protein
MKVNVYEWGTNRHFEKRLVAVERDVVKVKEGELGWMLTHINNERDFLLKSQYYIVVENTGGSL